MRRSYLLAAAALGLAAVGYIGVSWISKPSAAVAGPPLDPEIMYLCRETKALSRGPRQSTPVVNPATGRATLVQALYCPRCRRWRAAPPAALRERLGAGPICPVHHGPLFETKEAASGPAIPPTR